MQLVGAGGLQDDAGDIQRVLRGMRTVVGLDALRRHRIGLTALRERPYVPAAPGQQRHEVVEVLLAAGETGNQQRHAEGLTGLRPRAQRGQRADRRFDDEIVDAARPGQRSETTSGTHRRAGRSVRRGLRHGRRSLSRASESR